MKKSRYNYLAGLSDDTQLLFNFYTLNLLALTNREAKIARKILNDPSVQPDNNSGLFDLLFTKGFIVNDNIDEFQTIKEERNRSTSDNRQLSLTILPSLNCNFSCPYCYEQRRSDTLQKNTHKALIDFTSRNLSQNGTLSVDWFGGEPLIYMNIIENLTEKFLKICNTKNAPYTATIITNGYLLNERTIEKLVSLKIQKMQVTLDGPPQIHNKRRPHKSGKHTFRVILENIINAADRININIRMNVDQTNRLQINQLLDILESNNLQKKVGFYLGHTLPYTKACTDVSGSCLSNEDYSLVGLETLVRMLEHGFAYSYWIPKSKPNVCTADKNNSFVVSPDGHILQCWNEASESSRAIGHLDNHKSSHMTKNAHAWKNIDPFSRKECSACVLMPICMGGCPYMYKEFKTSNCHPWKYHLDESIACYYLLKIHEREIMLGRQLYDTINILKKSVANKSHK